MKTLWLLRHAKSSWADTKLADHDRPLKGRGVRAAKMMGNVLAQQAPFPEYVICSTAVRARETWRIAADAIARHRTVPAVVFRDDLYHAGAEQLRSIAASIPNEHSSVMLLGHHPGFEDFVTEVTGTTMAIPTAALLQLNLNASHWNDFATSRTVQVIHIWRPRELES